MDNSHVALVTVQLDADQFDFYRCDRNMPLGVNVSPTDSPLRQATGILMELRVEYSFYPSPRSSGVQRTMTS
jgi:hypothetical protein